MFPQVGAVQLLLTQVQHMQLRLTLCQFAFVLPQHFITHMKAVLSVNAQMLQPDMKGILNVA